MLLTSTAVLMVACGDTDDTTDNGASNGTPDTPETPDTPDNEQTPEPDNEDEQKNPENNNNNDNNNNNNNDNNDNSNDNNDDNTDGDDDDDVVPETPVIPSDADKIIGVRLVDGTAAASVSIPAKTDTVVYLVISEPVEGLYAELYKYTDKSTTNPTLTDLGYSEADGGYVLSFTVPADEEGTTFTFRLKQNGENLKSFRISVTKKFYVDPNGTMPA